MAVQQPSAKQVREIAAEIGLDLSEDDVASFHGIVANTIGLFDLVDEMDDNLPPVKYPRGPGTQPTGADNRYNAWYVKTSIAGAPSGKLAGRKVVLKDNILLAGVPMMNGSATLQGYVPDMDATVATRILDAGGEIVGKAHCESFCLSGGSHTNATGHVLNPHNTARAAGGSSSGCAALLAAGEVDMAIGGDQGGSIRMPAAFCGVYGMKATHGLVPYTGVMPIEEFVDHVGPMTNSVADNALLLEVIAGPDGYDPRQKSVAVHPYTEMLEGGAGGLKIGVLKEGFGRPESEPDVDAKVRAAAQRFAELGASVREVSVPWHLHSLALWMPIGLGGLAQTLFWGDGFGSGRPDLYVTSLMDRHRQWRQNAGGLSENGKALLIAGTYIQRAYGGRYYGKAMNIVAKLRAAYDEAFAKVDILLMPTVAMKATALPGPDATREEDIQRAVEVMGNAPAFNLTHHPAMNVPCGMSEGLPIGMMLVGRHFDEGTLYRAAYAFEQAYDWRGL